MKTRLCRVLAGLALTTAATTGVLTTNTVSADTAWGAPATEDDTAWGTPPGEGDPEPPADGDEGPSVAPFDTAWG